MRPPRSTILALIGQYRPILALSLIALTIGECPCKIEFEGFIGDFPSVSSEIVRQANVAEFGRQSTVFRI